MKRKTKNMIVFAMLVVLVMLSVLLQSKPLLAFSLLALHITVSLRNTTPKKRL